MKKHIHKIAVDKYGNRIMNDNGYWMCECGATIFPNCDWFSATKKSKKEVKELLKIKQRS